MSPSAHVLTIMNVVRQWSGYPDPHEGYPDIKGNPHEGYPDIQHDPREGYPELKGDRSEYPEGYPDIRLAPWTRGEKVWSPCWFLIPF